MAQQPQSACNDTGSQRCQCTPRSLPAASGSVFLSVLIAFFPKCAFCWAAYLSFLNSLGVTIPYLSWLKHVFAALFVLSVMVLFRNARRNGQWIAFCLILSGMLVLLVNQYAYPSMTGSRIGIAIVLAGSVFNAVSSYQHNKRISPSRTPLWNRSSHDPQ